MAIFKKNQKAEESTEAVKETKVKKTKVVKAEKVEKVEKKSGKIVSALALRTIVAPLATEKTAGLAEKGVYAFLVASNANRVAVRQAVRELYKVTPVKVNIINIRGKMKRFGRFSGRRADIKKALVTLPKGSHIDLFDTV